MSALINLIYGSSATQAMSNDMLLDILKTARANNRRLNVTGMLLYRDGNFLQVLEGEPDVVESLYQEIQRDPRHHQVTKFAVRPVTNRNFGEWEMGFVHLNTVDMTAVDGFTPFLSEPLNSEKFTDSSFALTFLMVFKDLGVQAKVDRGSMDKKPQER